MAGNFDDLKCDAYDIDHHGKEDGTTFAHSKGDVREEDEVGLDHSKGNSATDGIDQFSHAKVDEDMIIKYLANHVEIGANILISIFDYGGQTVFNVSAMFIYNDHSICSPFCSLYHCFLDNSSIFLDQIRYICTRLQYGVVGE
jgi:hypothetical protein